MIKVNLLREQGERVRKPSIRPTGSKSGILFAVILFVVAAGLAGYWYYLQHSIQTLTENRDRLGTDNARLLEWKREIAEFEKLKKLRERRIQVIERLKQSQTGPVTMLNQVIASMPRDNSVWLTLLDQKAERIQIAGFTVRNEALPDFMTSLMATGYFKTVDLELFEEAKDKDAARFSLVCTSALKPLAE